MASQGGRGPLVGRSRRDLVSLIGGVGLVLLSVSLAQAAPFLYVVESNTSVCVFDPSKGFTRCRVPNVVSVIDANSSSVIARVPVGDSSLGIAVHPSGTAVYYYSCTQFFYLS